MCRPAVIGIMGTIVHLNHNSTALCVLMLWLTWFTILLGVGRRLQVWKPRLFLVFCLGFIQNLETLFLFTQNSRQPLEFQQIVRKKSTELSFSGNVSLVDSSGVITDPILTQNFQVGYPYNGLVFLTQHRY